MIIITLLFIQLIKVVNSQDATNGCVSLANSKTCSAFSQFYIGLPGLAYEYPFLLNTYTIEEFDNRLLNYVNSTSDYLFPLGCLSSNYNPTIPYARYSITRLCAAMIQNPSYSLPCNFDNELTPPPLCQSTCFEWVKSITKITDNPRVCSDSIQRNNTLASVTEQCNSWEGFNGTVSDNCISGIANEPYSCGFGKNTRAACNYCKHNNEDKCCQTVNYCRYYLSVGAIIGIVIGCVGVVVMIMVLIVWLCCRKKRNPFHQFMPSAGSSTATTTSVSQLQQKPATAVLPKSSSFRDVPHNHSNDKLETTNEFSPALLPTTATPFSIGTATTEVDSINNEEFFVVIHHYEPKMPDELALNRGDIVCLALHFDDGWALGFNVTTGLKGAFPLVCISVAPEDSLDQLLNMEDVSSPASPPSEEQDNLHSTMDKLREDARKSLSLNSYHNSIHSIKNKNTNRLSIDTNQHNNNNNNNNNTIPKRSASYKSTYDYIEADSPSSPTLHTPFFNENVHRIQPTLQEQQQQQHTESQRRPSP